MSVACSWVNCPRCGHPVRSGRKHAPGVCWGNRLNDSKDPEGSDTMPEKITPAEKLPAGVYLIAFACGCQSMGSVAMPWAKEEMERTECETHKKPRIALNVGKAATAE